MGGGSKMEAAVELSEEMRVCVCVCVCLSDGSLHLPLSSRRTNYKVMDSRLITRATSGFKLAEPWSRAWSDGEGQERRGTWVQRENEVTARRKGKHLRGRAEFNKMY